jgi:TolB-like protein
LVSSDALVPDNEIDVPTPETTEVTRATDSQLGTNVDNPTVSDPPVTAPPDPEPVEEQVLINAAARPEKAEETVAENSRAIPPAPETVATTAASNAIAVIPFANLNLEGESSLGTSIHRTIETHLRNTDGLTTTAQQNDARYVINGAIQHVGPMARVTAQIVDTANDVVLGAIKIDGTTSESEHLESTIAKAILGQLGSVRHIADRDETANLTTLAVLPFDHLNAGAGNEESSAQNLSDTMTEEIANQVSIMESVNLVSTSESPLWTVEGSIQHLGNLVRVTVRVINNNTSAVVHAFKVDGTADDIVSLTEHVVSDLAETLSSDKLTNIESTARNTHPLFRLAGDRL